MIQCCFKQRFTVLALAFGGFCLQGMGVDAADLRDAAPPEAYMAKISDMNVQATGITTAIYNPFSQTPGKYT